MNSRIILFFALISSVHSFFLFSEPTTYCDFESVCYSYPENCEESECSIILSLGEQTTKVSLANFDIAESFLLYTVENGVTQEEMFVCYAGLDNCYYAHQVVAKPFVLEKQQKTEMSVVDEEQGRFAYTFKRALVKTGHGVEYFFKKVPAGGDSWAVEMQQLHYAFGDEWTVDLKRDDESTEVSNVETIPSSIVEIKSRQVESRARRVPDEPGIRKMTLEEVLPFFDTL